MMVIQIVRVPWKLNQHLHLRYIQAPPHCSHVAQAATPLRTRKGDGSLGCAAWAMAKHSGSFLNFLFQKFPATTPLANTTTSSKTHNQLRSQVCRNGRLVVVVVIDEVVPVSKQYANSSFTNAAQVAPMPCSVSGHWQSHTTGRLGVAHQRSCAALLSSCRYMATGSPIYLIPQKTVS